MSTRPFSIYLLKEGYNESNALREEFRLPPFKGKTNLPDDATIFILKGRPRDPCWNEYFGISLDLKQSWSGAIVFIHAENRCFAICLGHVSHLLKSESYEPDFGLIVTLNAVDPNKLKKSRQYPCRGRAAEKGPDPRGIRVDCL